MNPTMPFALIGIGTTELFVIAAIGSLTLALAAIPAILAYIVLKRVPAEHRKQEPALAFLLLVPIFSLIWMFFVHPKVAESLRSYFSARGDASHGDCGANLALWCCICAAGAVVPLIGLFAAVAAIVLLVLFYVKAFELSGRIWVAPV